MGRYHSNGRFGSRNDLYTIVELALNYLFNPENDIALAYGGRCYTPPPLARRLHDDGAPLPIWYGESGDGFVWPDPDMYWLEEISLLYGLEMLPSVVVGGASPWGWSLDARRQLLAAGVDNVLEDTHIERLRKLSHRRISVAVMKRLCERFDFPLPEIPYEAMTVNDLVSYVALHPKCYIKSPWSSSGRGVFCSDMLSEGELRRRVEGTIRRQGSVMCEIGLDKIADFAMLFYSDGIKVVRSGLSFFFNERGSAYVGNVIAPQNMLPSIIGVDEERLDVIGAELESILTDIICPDYTGYLGVDMMLYNGSNGVAIAPCIEVNLRMTMGVVAMKFGERFLAEGSRAVMRVVYNAPMQNINAVVESGRLVSGIQMLVPDKQGGFSISIEATEN